MRRSAGEGRAAAWAGTVGRTVAVVLGAAVLAACGDEGSGTLSRAEWQEQHGDLVAAFSRDLSDVVNTINRGERQSTLATCTQVAEDAEEVRQEALPVPDPEADAALRRAVDLGIQGAESCLEGGRNDDARAVEDAQRELSEARAAMDEFEAAVSNW